MRSELLDAKVCANIPSNLGHSVSLQPSISQFAEYFNGLERDQDRFELASSPERALSETAGIS